MTRTSLGMKTVLAIALAVTGLSVASIRVASAVRAAEATRSIQANPPQTAAPNADFWNVQGTVVDEQGRPAGGALVRTMPVFDGPANIEVTAAADGTFRFTLKNVSPSGLVGLMAEADGGSRMGLDDSFDRRRVQRSTKPARIVLKASRVVTVRVKDGAGAPVPGATVEAVEKLFRTHATAGADGVATLRIPADAHVDSVLAFRPGAGLDYFENYEKRGMDASGPLPEEVILTLEAAPRVRIRTVDSKGQAVAGVGIKPARLYANGKIDSLDARLCTTVRAVTDGQGIATFDWFPKGVSGLTRLSINPRAGYTAPDPLEYDPTGPTELKARVLRATRLSGTVRMPDGSPARRILVRANGWGSDASPPPMLAAQTSENGRYELDVPPEQAYLIAVFDDTWAARSLKNVAVRESQAQDGLDFALIKGTVLRGQVTEEPGHRPCAGAIVMLREQGGLLPKEFRGVMADKGELLRGTVTTDAQGKFQFRTGPGNYTVQGGKQLQRTELVKVNVTDESEIVRDLSLTMSRRETTFKGVVIEKTPTGERPVAKARVMISPLGPSTRADEQGRFELRRKPGPIVVFAYSQDQGLGGFTVVSADEANRKLVISKGAKITCRIVDTDGKPQAKHRVGIRLSPQNDSVPRFGISFLCDDQGRFAFPCAPTASEGELSAPHVKDARGRLTRARTVMPFDVDGLETVEVPDLVVPAEKGARP
jgi:protocatechuate 3,4-dioxygenase beta subunit